MVGSVAQPLQIPASTRSQKTGLESLPNELLLYILQFLYTGHRHPRRRGHKHSEYAVLDALLKVNRRLRLLVQYHFTLRHRRFNTLDKFLEALALWNSCIASPMNAVEARLAEDKTLVRYSRYSQL